MRGTTKRIAELEAQVAAKDAIIAEQTTMIVNLTAKVDEQKRLNANLRERLGRNSKNSHLSPSSDGPGARSGSDKGKGDDSQGKRPDNGEDSKRGKGGKCKTSKRKRGGQPNHRGHHRSLVPADQVDHVVDLFPSQCDCCGDQLPERQDTKPSRHQVTEIPEIKPTITEYRRHSVRCGCGNKVRASLDQVPKTSFGPRLMSIVTLLTGVFHLSRRQAVRAMDDILGTKISLGGVSSIEKRVSGAIEPAVAEAESAAQGADIKHADATSWLEGGAKRTLWVIATTMVTVFKIVTDGGRDHRLSLFGSCNGILVSDRATVFLFWRMKKRQVCWAHLLRRFVAFSERDGPAAQLGEELLAYTELLFEYWHDYQAGRLSRTKFCAWMAPVQADLEKCLQRAVDACIDGVSGSCADMLAHREALWTFVTHHGVPPTNNHGEQELRGFVLWRKRCFGAQSARGHRFAERIMTVAHTARKQNINVLQFLYDACRASMGEGECPSLLPGLQAAA